MSEMPKFKDFLKFRGDIASRLDSVIGMAAETTAKLIVKKTKNSIDKVAWAGTDSQSVKLTGRPYPIVPIPPKGHRESLAKFQSALDYLGTTGRAGDIVGHRVPYMQMRGTPQPAKPYSARRAAIENPYAVVPYVAPEWGPAASSDAANLISQQARGAINVSGIKDFTGRRASYDEMYKTASLPETFYAPVTQEQAAKWNELREKGRQGLKERQTRARYNIWRDSLDDYEQEVHELSKRYAGAPNARKAAEDKIRNDALKKLPKTVGEILKTSRVSTKNIVALAKNPQMRALAKHPYAIPFAGAIAGLKLFDAFLAKSDEGNKNVVNWQNAANLYGTPSRKFSDAAFLAGVKDPGAVSRMYGKLTSIFGDADVGAEILGNAMKDAPPLARMAVAKSLGLDENDIATMDIMSGRLKVGKARSVNAATNKQLAWREMALSSDGDLGDTVRAIGSYVPGVMRSAARTEQDTINAAYSDRVNRMIDSAIESYDESKRTPSPNMTDSSTSSTRNIIINGPVNLPNVRNPDGFVDELEREATARRAVLNDNDPMEK